MIKTPHLEHPMNVLVVVLSLIVMAGVIIGAVEHSTNIKRDRDIAASALDSCERGNDIRAWQIAWARAEIKNGHDSSELPLAQETIRSVHILDCTTKSPLPKVAEDAYVTLRFPPTLRPLFR